MLFKVRTLILIHFNFALQSFLPNFDLMSCKTFLIQFISSYCKVKTVTAFRNTWRILTPSLAEETFKQQVHVSGPESSPAAPGASVSCTLSPHCWCELRLCSLRLCSLPASLRMDSCSPAGFCTLSSPAGAERFSERSTSWTRLSTPPSAASETPRGALRSASSSSYPPSSWAVSTESL